MRLFELHVNEASPDNLEGSMSRDQILSRIWMARKLKDVAHPKHAIVLGSWYGILPYALKKFKVVDKVAAIDNEPGCLKISQKLNPGVKHILNDCNAMDYKDYDCIINPSVNNIEGSDWYNNIPKGKLCLFQTENIELGNGCPSDLDSMKNMYPLSKYLYSGNVKSHDKDGDLIRSMVIGIK